MNNSVQVCTPCRLHFGMFGFGQPDKAQYGGVGLMIEPPRVKVTISPARSFAVRGSHADRAHDLVEWLARKWSLPFPPACEIMVESPRGHTGLGVGTQMNLAIASGLRRFLDLSDLFVEGLAIDSGRGARSAVGTHGFRDGGLIVDAGKGPGQRIGKLAARRELPDRWRFVLFCPPGGHGLAGRNEATAFARLPPVPDEITDKLWMITNEQMLPAVDDGDCQRFGEAIYQFGRLAGECFSAVQRGPFANAEIARLVEAIRDFGVSGAGQSSWGPTVYAITANDTDAQQLVDRVRGKNYAAQCEITIARANNSGAMIESRQ